jgi:hypothetical protein
MVLALNLGKNRGVVILIFLVMRVMTTSRIAVRMISVRSLMVSYLGLIAITFQVLSHYNNSKSSNIPKQRKMEKGVDDDRIDLGNSFNVTNDDREWYTLEHWLKPASLAYDIVEGFLYVADAFFIAWVLWGCLVHCGIVPDERIQGNRRFRRVKDGRGVFAPLRDFDALDSSDDEDDNDDDQSHDSMEYGDAHDEDEYNEVDLKQVAENIEKAAEDFFSKAERSKGITSEQSEDRVLRDLEMAVTQHKGKADPADVIFL